MKPALIAGLLLVLVSAALVAGPAAGVTSSYRSEIIADSPSGYWRLGEASGTSAGDSSSYQNPGTYQGGITLAVAGAIYADSDTATRLDGVDDRINMGDPPSGSLDFGTSDFTVEGWVRTSANGGQVIVGKRGATGTWWQLTVSSDRGHVGQVLAAISDGSGKRQAYSSLRVDDGRWHHVAAAFDRDTAITVYVDAVAQKASGASTRSIDNGASLQAGYAAGSPAFKGDLDELALYRALLPAGRIAVHYQAAIADTIAPTVAITTPAQGSTTPDTTPTLSGTAGSAASDSATVTIKVYGGSSAGGTAVQTLSTSRDASGAWTVDPSSPLAPGTYTAQAEQSDASGNRGLSGPRTFTISGAPLPDYRARVLADSPRGYWRLGETSGLSAVDETAGGNTGVYAGDVTLAATGAISGDSNAALRLGGTDGALNLGDPQSGAFDFGSGDFSVEAWVRTSVNLEQVIASKQDSSGPYWQVTVTDDEGEVGEVRAKIYDGLVSKQAYGPAVRVDDGRWHHVLVTFDRDSEIAIYVDGTSVRRSTGAVTGSVSNAAPLLFGGEAAWYPAFAGDLDEVAVYANTLGAAAVKAHYDEAYVYDTTEPSVTLTTPSPLASTTDTTPTFAGAAGTATGDLSRVVVNVYSGSLPTGTPVQTASTVSDRSGGWAAEPSPPLTPGTYTARAEQADGAGNVGRSAPATFTIAAPPPSPPSDPVLLAAGDIAACDSTGDEATANLLDGLSGTVAAVGDTVYPSGTDQQFADCYDPSWGRHKSRTRPAVGDHEYETPGAGGYFRYFGASAGDPAKGYYSYDLGAWHVVVLNSTCVEVGGCDAGSAQEQWLRADLAAHPASCTLAYWGEARFSSGSIHGNHPEMEPFWQALADYGAEVVLSGDDHVYERFAPQTPAGYLDLSAGITQFVIGTGGSWHYGFDAPEANSQVRNGDTFGILKLSLHSTSYDWQFVPVASKSFTDLGSRPCH